MPVGHHHHHHLHHQVNSQKFVRGFLEALNDNDEERVEELLISASEAKLDKEAMTKKRQIRNVSKRESQFQKVFLLLLSKASENGFTNYQTVFFNNDIFCILIIISGGGDGGADGEQHKLGRETRS